MRYLRIMNIFPNFLYIINTILFSNVGIYVYTHIRPGIVDF